MATNPIFPRRAILHRLSWAGLDPQQVPFALVTDYELARAIWMTCLEIALAALGRYDSAVREIKRGLEIDPDWPRSGFTLADLYGDNGKAKTAHLDATAKAAAKAESSDLLFLIGVYLHFDGQVERGDGLVDVLVPIGGFAPHGKEGIPGHDAAGVVLQPGDDRIAPLEEHFRAVQQFEEGHCARLYKAKL